MASEGMRETIGKMIRKGTGMYFLFLSNTLY